ncbi:WYL domain-containing protein [Micromonospora sp. NPDC050276]|uniref:WYL domain-containing protein n=1 Tax=Micromonospora sp. NPDC050276 TaxID=3364278 RepID=UPI00379F1DE9
MSSRTGWSTPGGGGTCWGGDAGRDDRRTFRADRIQHRVPTGLRFAPREPPGGDAVAHVLRGVGSTAWPHPARVRLHAAAETMAQRIPTTAGLLEAIDERTCLLHTGGESLGNLAAFLGTLGVDFDVLDPPELRAAIRDVAARFARAAGPGPG